MTPVVTNQSEYTLAAQAANYGYAITMLASAIYELAELAEKAHPQDARLLRHFNALPLDETDPLKASEQAERIYTRAAELHTWLTT